MSNYLIFINLLAFITYYVDKKLAKRKKFRISEKCLFFLSFMGGSIGSLLAMYIFRHKTKKKKFLIINIISLIFWLILTFFYFYDIITAF